MKANRDAIRHLAAVVATVVVNFVVARYGHMPAWLPQDTFLGIVDMLVLLSVGHDVARVRRVRRSSQHAQDVKREVAAGAQKNEAGKVE